VVHYLVVGGAGGVHSARGEGSSKSEESKALRDESAETKDQNSDVSNSAMAYAEREWNNYN